MRLKIKITTLSGAEYVGTVANSVWVKDEKGNDYNFTFAEGDKMVVGEEVKGG